MTYLRNDAAPQRRWPEPQAGRVPYWVYTDEALYGRELERIFYGPNWCYVGLSAEVPEAGDFKTTLIGERPVIAARAEDGTVAVLENRCAHRGVQLCFRELGRNKEFVCPYHQWTYALNGELTGVSFLRG
ncbi:MAG: Rieske 2Fe-2S domain-containing protein, partial [Roseiarcus sp.]